MFPNNKKSIIIPILYMALIFLLSSIPCDEENKLGGLIYIKPTIQNILHIPLFGLLAFLWMKAFNDKQLELKKAITYTLIITIFYSAFDEFYQDFIPGRYASLGDFFFNIAGCLGGVVGYRLAIG
jgi:VanZ family protein